LNSVNIGKALAFQIFTAHPYTLPANGVLAPTTDGLFQWIKIKRVELWGPTAGDCQLILNSDANALIYPKPTTTGESRSVTNKPYDSLQLKKPFDMVVNTVSGATNLFLVSFHKPTTAVAAADNTVILQLDCIAFG
jgi:hypothetical protein